MTYVKPSHHNANSVINRSSLETFYYRMNDLVQRPKSDVESVVPNEPETSINNRISGTRRYYITHTYTHIHVYVYLIGKLYIPTYNDRTWLIFMTL